MGAGFRRFEARQSLSDALIEDVRMARAGRRAARRPSSTFNAPSAAEVIRLKGMGASREKIAALLRMPYCEIEAALELAGDRV